MKCVIFTASLLCAATQCCAQFVPIEPITRHNIGLFHHDFKEDKGQWLGIRKTCRLTNDKNEPLSGSKAEDDYECEYTATALKYTEEGVFVEEPSPVRDQTLLETMYQTLNDLVYQQGGEDEATKRKYSQAKVYHETEVRERDEHTVGRHMDEFEIESGFMKALAWKRIRYWVTWSPSGEYYYVAEKIIFNDLYEFVLSPEALGLYSVNDIWLEENGVNASVVVTYSGYCGNSGRITCPINIAVFDYASLMEGTN